MRNIKAIAQQKIQRLGEHLDAMATGQPMPESSRAIGRATLGWTSHLERIGDIKLQRAVEISALEEVFKLESTE